MTPDVERWGETIERPLATENSPLKLGPCSVLFPCIQIGVPAADVLQQL